MSPTFLRELFVKRDQLPESIRLFRKAVELDPNFARAWAGLAAVETVADDYIFDDGIDHLLLSKEAAEKAISLNPDLSMPLAVLGNVVSVAEGDILSSIDYYDAAIEKDAKNTTAWLWRGMDLHNSGFLDEAMASYQQCIDIDPGYHNCRQHLARVYMDKGDAVTAHRLHGESLEHMFHAGSDAFVSTYVRGGHRNLALLIADLALGSDGAPVIEWIRAIEKPSGDNSVGFVRLKDWESRTDTGRRLAGIPELLLSFRAYDELLKDPVTATTALWRTEAEEFRTTPQFKAIIREVGIFEYWQARGFPPHCKPVGDDDFECGRSVVQ